MSTDLTGCGPVGLLRSPLAISKSTDLRTVTSRSLFMQNNKNDGFLVSGVSVVGALKIGFETPVFSALGDQNPHFLPSQRMTSGRFEVLLMLLLKEYFFLIKL